MLYADIAGWGSTFEAGPKPYRHIPIQIVPPGDVQSVSWNISFSATIHLDILRQEMKLKS